VDEYCRENYRQPSRSPGRAISLSTAFGHELQNTVLKGAPARTRSAIPTTLG